MKKIPCLDLKGTVIKRGNKVVYFDNIYNTLREGWVLSVANCKTKGQRVRVTGTVFAITNQSHIFVIRS